MVDAVSSNVASAAVLQNAVNPIRANVEVSAPAEIETVARAPQAPFISPYISVDPTFNPAVLQIRDPETGDVQDQFPTRSRLAEISSAQQRQELTTSRSEGAAPQQQQAQASDIVTVQEVTAAPPSNGSIPSPQIAVAALSAGAQSAQPAAESAVSVLA